MPQAIRVRAMTVAAMLLCAVTGCTLHSGQPPSEPSTSQFPLPAPSDPPGPAVPSDAPAATVSPPSAPSTVTWSTDEAIGICKEAINARGALLDWSTVSIFVEDQSSGDYSIRFEYQDGSPSTGCNVSGTVDEPAVILSD